jgi:hypothetical protein
MCSKNDNHHKYSGTSSPKTTSDKKKKENPNMQRWLNEREEVVYRITADPAVKARRAKELKRSVGDFYDKALK